MRIVTGGLGLLLAAAVLLPRPAAAAGDGRIGVYADLNATQTTVTFSIGVPRTLYVVATLDGQTAGGLTTAEFRITGLPADWAVFVAPNPAANVVLGDPFRRIGDIHRALIAFPGCQVNEGRVLLYTAIVIANSQIPPTDLVVEAGDPPTNPAFASPLLTRCDSPDFTKVRVEGGTFRMEVRAPQDLDYSEVSGYDHNRGVVPQSGRAGDLFRFRVVYTNSSGASPASGWPRLELDANEDGDSDDSGEGLFTMSPADLDSTFENGKAYRFDIALGSPPGGRYRYRFAAQDGGGNPAVGVATQWNDSLFVSSGLPNLAVHAEEIQVEPASPRQIDTATLSVAVANLSDAAVGNLVVRIEDVFGNAIAERTLAALGPRARTDVVCRWRFADSGYQPVIVRVDPADDIAESDESDNVASHGVFVGGSGVAGLFVISGLPPAATVPPVAPFALVGAAHYVVGAGSFPQRPVSNALVTVRPSWEAEFTMRSDADGNFRVPLTPPAIPGLYQVGIEVDDGSHAQTSVTSVNVSAPGGGPHASNLVVQATAALGTGCPPSAIVVSWSIENRGDRDSQPTTARLLADGAIQAAEIAVAAIPAGGVLALPAAEVAVAGAGFHWVTAHVDPGSTLRELREDDNTAVTGIHVPAACLDLAVADVDHTGTMLCSDTDIPIRVRIENRGCVTTAPARVVCQEGATELASGPFPSLAPGESATVPFMLQFGEACHDLVFVVDPEGAAGADCDNGSDATGAALCPAECEAPPPPPPVNFRVQPCDLAASNPAPAAGEAVLFTLWIRNASITDAAAAEAQFLLDDLPLGPVVAVPPIPAGERVQVASAIPWNVDFAVHTLRAVVDPLGQDEFDPANNQTERRLPFDLSVQPINHCPPSFPRVFSTCGPCVGDSLTVRAQILNAGLFTCTNVRVEFRDGDTGPLLAAVTLPSVPGNAGCGAAATPALAQIAYGTAGSHLAVALVDPANTIPEYDETNAPFRAGIDVALCGAKPDLVASVNFPGGVPAPGTVVSAVEVHVTNIGLAPAAAAQARLTLDGAPLCALMGMGDIAPGATSMRVCQTPWTVSTANCVQRLEVCADPAGTIDEVNESNNCALRVMNCMSAPDLVAAITFVGPAPQPGDSVTAVQVEVTNIGDAPATAVQARLTLDDVPLCDVIEMGDIAPGEKSSRTCTAPWVAPPAGACAGAVLEACADPQNQIGEWNEANNCSVRGVGAVGNADLALEPYSIHVEPPNPAPFQQVSIRVGIYNLPQVAATCALVTEWSLAGDSWLPVSILPLSLPAGVFFIPNAASFGWVTPSATAHLRFSLVNVCPEDDVLWNNVAQITLPWFDAPGTPVTITDLEIASRADGVRITWRAEPGAESFAFDRRREGDALWQRLPATVAAEPGIARTYEFVDRDAEFGARLEYRIVVRLDGGEEETGGVVRVTHDAVAALSQVLAVRPQPFRPGGHFEFSLREPTAVQLDIFDSAGRRVAALRRGAHPAGRHVVAWDGRDHSGRRVPAGVYFCRFTTQSQALTQRVVLLP
jgi:subtilase family serine protease